MSTFVTIRVVHSYRETNQLADMMANITLDREGNLMYYSFQEMPSICRKILNMDKSEVLSLRIRTKRLDAIENRDLQTTGTNFDSIPAGTNFDSISDKDK